MPVFIDLPATTITTAQVQVAGWAAAAWPGAAVGLLINGQSIPFIRHHRPDVTAAFPGLAFSTGIDAAFSLFALPVATSLEVTLSLGAERVQKTIPVAPAMLVLWHEQANLRHTHHQFCLAHLRCPVCGMAGCGLQRQREQLHCTACGETFTQSHSALNLISERLAVNSNIAPTNLVSANPYTPAALALIARITSAGGMVLDCGAGARPARLPNVINAEIVDYPATDILAVGESLPFADATFDAVLSLAVLEHVRDPFKCAAEILRVLKPGGEVIADVPLLQPVHGYPHHYYNMTMQGLRNLFAGGTSEISYAVPPHGHPIFGVQWILRDYLAGLDPELQPQFAALTVADLIALNPAEFLGQPLAALTPQALETIACLNTLHVKKDAASLS